MTEAGPDRRPPGRAPRATYRVQLHPGFTFDDLVKIVPALRDLGVDTCYCSPVFRATEGSLHGYDVCDYEVVNPEIGGEDGFRRLSRELRAHDMGLMLDFVPNHMGIDGPFNHWWRDVLRLGPRSEYADFFDIQWHDREDSGRARVSAPLLPEHYGRMLERGDIQLVLEGGALLLAIGSMRLPVRPETEREILGDDAARVAPSLVEERLRRLNGRVGEPGSFDELDRIIGNQHYRLIRWQAGAHGTNYRRFFAIDTLIGVRVEDPRVFECVHAKLGSFAREGLVDALRIDHIDGLRDPATYLKRLQDLVVETPEIDRGRFPVYVEKILADGESLPRDWATAGTTGYEFIAQLAGVFTAAHNESAFNEIYRAFTGMDRAYAAEVRRNKRLVLDEMFANTVQVLAQQLRDHLQVDRRWRDYTVIELAAAIRAIMTGLCVYRTYRGEKEPPGDSDRMEIGRAAELALTNNARVEPDAIRFVRDILLGDYPEPEAYPPHRDAMCAWALTFQQYSGAVMAKAVEDTTYYTYNRLAGLNEVGGDPGAFGKPIDEFHRANRLRFERAPRAMLTTSTHDTKVSEDARARLLALSEIPDEWRAWLDEWRQANHSAKARVGHTLAPDPNEEYRLYQMLLAAWPVDREQVDDIFRKRIQTHLRKAVNEAKVHTSILRPNPAWLEACDRFVARLLDPDGAFIERLVPAAQRLARFGMVNSLAQVALKLTCPGVPDIYQGNQAWDFSLVDPDNRRPVNHDAFRLLAEAVDRTTPTELLERWTDGAIKFALTRSLLRFRRAHEKLFESGAYEPLTTDGVLADHVVAFGRRTETERFVTVVPRHVARLAWPPVGRVWAGTAVRSSADFSLTGTWRDVATGRTFSVGSAGELGLDEAFRIWPVAVLHRSASDV